MPIKKVRSAGLVGASRTVKLPGKFCRLLGIRSRNWASSAMAAAGTDTATKISITDANGNVVFLDAADRDYATAEVSLALVGIDDTTTGLGQTAVDATGAAPAAGENTGGIIVESPLTVAIVNGGTATDYQVVDLIVET